MIFNCVYVSIMRKCVSIFLPRTLQVKTNPNKNSWSILRQGCKQTQGQRILISLEV